MALVALRRIEARQQSAALQPEDGAKANTTTYTTKRAPITAFSPKPKRKLGPSTRQIEGAAGQRPEGGAGPALKRARR